MSSRQTVVLQWLRSRLPVSQEERMRRAAFIADYRFPDGLQQRFAAAHPQLEQTQCEAVWEGLREYFYLCHLSGTKFVAMPSEAADAAWHEFILWTREYEQFCQNAFGRFLHHTPATAAGNAAMNDAYWQAWRLACGRERLNPSHTTVLPLLFALDASIGFGPSPEAAELSYRYRRATGGSDNGGSSDGGSSSCGGSSGDGCSDSSTDGGCGDSSSCGGSSCGGGCGGGGD